MCLTWLDVLSWLLVYSLLRGVVQHAFDLAWLMRRYRRWRRWGA